jgi:hypothetical protein
MVLEGIKFGHESRQGQKPRTTALARTSSNLLLFCTKWLVLSGNFCFVYFTLLSVSRLYSLERCCDSRTGNYLEKAVVAYSRCCTEIVWEGLRKAMKDLIQDIPHPDRFSNRGPVLRIHRPPRTEHFWLTANIFCIVHFCIFANRIMSAPNNPRAVNYLWRIRSKSLWRSYISTYIMFLDIIQRLVFI